MPVLLVPGPRTFGGRGVAVLQAVGRSLVDVLRQLWCGTLRGAGFIPPPTYPLPSSPGAVR